MAIEASKQETSSLFFFLRKETLEVFERYMDADKKARQLNRSDAIRMLEAEFELPNEQANQIFDVFDRDKNGIMSIWEFQQFHQCVGIK